MTSQPELGQLTHLLRAYQEGKEEALAQFFEILMPELRRRARLLFANERPAHTLQPTALVSEAFLRLFDGQPIPWEDSQAFLLSATTEMRRTLADHARRADAKKRQRRKAIPLGTEHSSPSLSDPDFVIALDQALRKLAEESPRAVQVVELTVFSELKSREIGEVLGVSYRTVEREWQWARKWLKRELSCNRNGNE